jgi:hypothetical protein
MVQLVRVREGDGFRQLRSPRALPPGDHRGNRPRRLERPTNRLMRVSLAPDFRQL